jgi:hypothetical protein
VRKSRLFAVGAALVLIAAGCGDDDDAADDTSPATVAAPATAAAPAESATAESAAPAGTVDTASTLPGAGASPEQASDCQVLFAALSEVISATDPPDLNVGDEISDEYKDAIQSLVDALDGLELETDEVRAAVDSLADYANEVLNSDTWTEELEAGSQEATTPLTNLCAATLAESPPTT